MDCAFNDWMWQTRPVAMQFLLEVLFVLLLHFFPIHNFHRPLVASSFMALFGNTVRLVGRSRGGKATSDWWKAIA